MKRVVCLLLTGLIFFACNERKSRIEVIEDYDNIYLSEDKVDKHAQPTNNNENFVEELKNILKDLHGDTNKKMFYPISYKVYINKQGKIDKIMDYSHYMNGYLMASRIDGNKDLTEKNIFKDVDELTKKILPFFEKFKFSPAELDGKSVPFKTKVQTMGIVDENGEATFEISFLNGYSFGPDHEVQKNDEYFVAVEEMPSPIGGIKAIQEKIIYPEIAKRTGIEGRVYIKALINENGDVAKAEVIKGIGAGCDEMAIDAVRNTKFIPGRQRGEAVKVQVSIPILFKLSDDKFKGESKILGKWEGKSNKGEKIKISFFNDGLTNLYKSQSGIVDGKRTGATFAPTYKIDSTTTPYKLDLDLNEHTFSKSLLKFITRDSIVIGRSLNKNIRPQNFNQDNIYEIWKLKRVK